MQSMTHHDEYSRSNEFIVVVVVVVVVVAVNDRDTGLEHSACLTTSGS